MIVLELKGSGFVIRIEEPSLEGILMVLQRDQFEDKVRSIGTIWEHIGGRYQHQSVSILDYVSPYGSSLTDRVVLCLLYSSEFESMDIVNKTDVELLLFRIREPLPANINSILNNLVSSRLLVRHREKKDGLVSFYLSAEGIAYGRKLRGDDQ
jgi:hypothetical protein